MKMQLMATVWRTSNWLCVAAILGTLTACGPSGPREIPVKGKVTFGGGAWPKPATLDFAPVAPAAGMPNRPATVVIEGDGTYEVKLIPGQYVVNVSCNEVEPLPDNPSTAKSYIPDRFRIGEDQQKVDVPLDAKGPVELSWDIPKS
jgi:hypothetical protein